MNVRAKLNSWKQEMKSIWRNARANAQNKNQKPDQSRVMTPEEKLDEEIDESFPASDPPGHYSKSVEDKELH